MCSSADCAGCAYSKLSAMFHSGPRRECYQRFLIRTLPWNVIRMIINKMKTALRRLMAAHRRKRQEESHKEHTYAVTGLS